METFRDDEMYMMTKLCFVLLRTVDERMMHLKKKIVDFYKAEYIIIITHNE